MPLRKKLDKFPSLFRWETAFEQQILAQHYARRIVDVKELNCHDAGFGFANQSGSLPAKMAGPLLFSRIEQPVEFAIQESGHIWSFGPVAFGTGKTELIGIVGAKMLLGDDVLDMKCQEIRFSLMLAMMCST
jgi:hypothetical protein